MVNFFVRLLKNLSNNVGICVCLDTRLKLAFDYFVSIMLH